MAYESQAIDLAGRVTENTRKLLAAIEALKNDIAYNTSTAVVAATGGGEEPIDLYNGITNDDVLGVFTSILALDTFLASNWHYTNLNKVR